MIFSLPPSLTFPFFTDDQNLLLSSGDAMNILMEMVDETEDIRGDTTGTSTEAAWKENILAATTDAALSAVMKHIK